MGEAVEATSGKAAKNAGVVIPVCGIYVKWPSAFVHLRCAFSRQPVIVANVQQYAGSARIVCTI